MSVLVGLFIAVVVVAAVAGIAYVVGGVTQARAVERHRHAAQIRQQRAEARIQAASAQTIQQMLDLAHRIQDAERRSS